MEVGVESNAKAPAQKHSFSPVTGGSPVKYFGIAHHGKQIFTPGTL